MNTYLMMYLLTRVDGLRDFVFIIAVLLFVSTIIILMTTFVGDWDGGKKHIKWLLPVTIITSLIYVAIPSQKDIVLIVAGGKTVDFIKSDTSINKIPSQTTAIISDFLDNQLKQLNQKDTTNETNNREKR